MSAVLSHSQQLKKLLLVAVRKTITDSRNWPDTATADQNTQVSGDTAEKEVEAYRNKSFEVPAAELCILDHGGF